MRAQSVAERRPRTHAPIPPIAPNPPTGVVITERRRKSRRGGSDAPVAAVAVVAEIGGILRGAAGRMIVTVNNGCLI